MKRNAAGEPAFTCARHGEQVWGFEVICLGCGARWQLRDEHAPRYAKKFCTCHRLLIGPKGAGSAVPLCTACATSAGEA